MRALWASSTITIGRCSRKAFASEGIGLPSSPRSESRELSLVEAGKMLHEHAVLVVDLAALGFLHPERLNGGDDDARRAFEVRARERRALP